MTIKLIPEFWRNQEIPEKFWKTYEQVKLDLFQIFFYLFLIFFPEFAIPSRLALEVSGLDLLSDRRLSRCLDFSLKCTKVENTSRFFPKNPNLDLTLEARHREEFIVNFSRTKQYQNSTIPFCQRLLNDYLTKQEGQETEGEGRRQE